MICFCKHCAKWQDKIDAKIKSFERLVENPDHLGNENCGTCSTFKQIIEVLKDLKKE